MTLLLVSDALQKAFEDALIAQMPYIVGGCLTFLAACGGVCVAYLHKIKGILKDNGKKLDLGNQNTSGAPSTPDSTANNDV